MPRLDSKGDINFAHDADSSCDSIASSEASIHQSGGTWHDDEIPVPWNGCVCGKVHERPVKVFWIQCDGPCQTWYNVRSECVGLSPPEATRILWYCRACQEVSSQQPDLVALLSLPDEVWMRILAFCAPRTYRASVLTKISMVNKFALQFVYGRMLESLWKAILTADYLDDAENEQRPSLRIRRSSPTRRSPKRHCRRGSSKAIPTNEYSSLVQEQHLLLLNRTEDAFHAIEEAADPLIHCRSPERMSKIETRLTLRKLQQLLNMYAPIDLNRCSPHSGRTLLQVCCAAEMDQGCIVSCVNYLLRSGADPNVFSRNESPLANRPAIYFAVSRAMPNLIQTLLDAGADANVRVKGEFRFTFNTDKTIEGTLSPLELTRTLIRLDKTQPPSSYWSGKLNECARTLEQCSPR